MTWSERPSAARGTGLTIKGVLFFISQLNIQINIRAGVGN